MCERSTKGTPPVPCGGAADAAPVQKSHNYDNATGRRVNPAGGNYMIPADQYAAVVARAAYDKRILNCYRFVPLAAHGPPCLPASAPARPRRR